MSDYPSGSGGDRKRWLLNAETGRLHDRDHFTENCNTDDIARKDRLLFHNLTDARAHERYESDCKHCWHRAKRSGSVHAPVVAENPFDAAAEA